MIAARCGIAPGAPIGGCDPPQPTSIGAAKQMLSAKRLKSRLLMVRLLLAP
jgi:hypothetical protein